MERKMCQAEVGLRIFARADYTRQAFVLPLSDGVRDHLRTT